MFAQTLEHLLNVLVALVRGRGHLILDRLVHLGRLLFQGQPARKTSII